MTNYVTAEDLKKSLELTGTTNVDRDVERALPAASKAIEEMCSRKFWQDSAAVDRYYTSDSPWLCMIDDLEDGVDVTVSIDTGGNYGYATTWTENVHYRLGPANAPADDKPYEHLRAIMYSLPCHPDAIRVNAQFGWSDTPPQIVEATVLLANKLIVRVRQAPFGIVSAGIDSGAVMRIARTDPDVVALVEPFVRSRRFA